MTKPVRLQKPHNHLKVWIVLVLCAILLVGFGCGLKWDYEISDAIFNQPKYSDTMHIILMYMMIPFAALAFCISFALIISSFSYKKEKVIVPILGTILGIGTLVYFGWYMWFCMDPTLEHFGEVAGTINNAIVICAVAAGCFIFDWFVIKPRADKLMFRLSLTYVLELAVTVFLLIFLRDLWSRPIPINAFAPNEHAFEPWWNLRPFYDWTVQDKNLEFWSTPSGFGTQGAIAIFGFVQICDLANKFDEKKLTGFFFYGGVAYTVLAGVVRMMAGESYLTDICFSFISALWVCYLTRYISGKIREAKREHYVILLAGGTGKRMHIKTPKCFIEVDGMEMFQHSLETFKSIRGIRNIFLVVPKSKRSMFGTGDNGRVIVCTGGSTRNESFEKAIKKINKIAHSNDQIIIHDAARPFISKKDILAIMKSKEKFGTLVTVGKQNKVDYHIGKYNVLTPQFIRYDYYRQQGNMNDDGVDLISYLNLKPQEKNFIISSDAKAAKKITYKSDL